MCAPVCLCLCMCADMSKPPYPHVNSTTPSSIRDMVKSMVGQGGSVTKRKDGQLSFFFFILSD